MYGVHYCWSFFGIPDFPLGHPITPSHYLHSSYLIALVVMFKFNCLFQISYVFRYIAMITKQRAFNKSQIDADTQIIFMDEAYAKLLDPDDWKVR